MSVVVVVLVKKQGLFTTKIFVDILSTALLIQPEVVRPK